MGGFTTRNTGAGHTQPFTVATGRAEWCDEGDTVTAVSTASGTADLTRN